MPASLRDLEDGVAREPGVKNPWLCAEVTPPGLAFGSPALIISVRTDTIQFARRSSLLLSETLIRKDLVQTLRDLGIAHLSSAMAR